MFDFIDLIILILLFSWVGYYFLKPEQQDKWNERVKKNSQNLKDFCSKVKMSPVFTFLLCFGYTCLLLGFPFHTFIATSLCLMVILIKMIS